MNFSTEKIKYIERISLTLIFFVIVMFFTFMVQNIYAQKENSATTDVETKNKESDLDGQNDLVETEENFISQNMEYLSPQFILSINSTDISGTFSTQNKLVLTDDSFSLPSTINIDYKKNNTKNSLQESVGGNKITYTVRSGDTMQTIADKFGITVSTIKVENDLTNSTIRKGQELTILPTSGFTYTVRKGDTLKGIASRNNITSDEIELYNYIESLQSGKDIIIPVKNYYKKIEVPQKPKITTTSQTAPTKTYAQSSSVKSTNTSVSSSGYYTNPAPGSVKTQGIHGRNAVDLASPGGRYIPIVAAASGAVKRARHKDANGNAGWHGGYGLNVLVSHSNGAQTLYAHMSNVIVYEGQYVKKGQVIGYMGSTGRSTGVHLHFEILGGARNPF